MSASKYLWSIVILAAIGCTPRTPVATNSSSPSTPSAAPTTPAAPTAPPVAPATPTAPVANPVTPTIPGLAGIPGAADASAQLPGQATQPTERVKAETGVGIKGQSLKEHTGVLVEPAKAYFRVEQKVVFDVQIPSAMKLFQATEGRFPNSEAEFMSKIIAANQINLPKLPQGHKYVYDAQAGELMVEKPKQ